MSRELKPFITPHCHIASLDSASTPEQFLKREVELGTGAMTVTDHGSLGATRKVYKLAKKKGLIPCVGIEGYFRDDDCPILSVADYPKNATGAFTTAPKYSHLTIGLPSAAAYDRCIPLLSAADARLEATLACMEPKHRKHGGERKPLFVWSDLEELAAAGAIFGSGCLIGMVGRHLLDNDDRVVAEQYYQRLRGMVRPGHWFVEVFPHDCSKNWQKGVFFEAADGKKLKFHDDKNLRVVASGRQDSVETTAAQLAAMWGATDMDRRTLTLLAQKDYSKWVDVEPVEIVKVEAKEEYIENDCSPAHPDPDVQRRANRFMLGLAKKYGDPCLISDDSHFAYPEDKIIQDVRLMTTSKGNWRMWSTYDRKSSADALTFFQQTLDVGEEEVERWIDNSYGWRDMFRDFTLKAPTLLPTKFYPQDSLRHTIELIQKHGRMDWSNERYVARIREEIDLLHRNGTVDLLPYFFPVEEMVAVSEQARKLPGPGRGSAAGVLLTYLLSITHADPIRYGLSLERFLTQDRVIAGKFPDIDQDFADRDVLLNPEDGWLWKRFGDHAIQIGTETKIKLRLAVKDVHRVRHGKVDPQVEALTSRFVNAPQGIEDYKHVFGYKNGEEEVVGTIHTDAALIEYIQKYPEEWALVQRCLGLGRGRGRHACGHVISNRPVHDVVPLTTVGGVRVTEYDAKGVEEAGLVKYDILEVRALANIGDCLEVVRQRAGGAPAELHLGGRLVPNLRLTLLSGGGWADVWDLPDDPAVYADIATSRIDQSVFQFGSPSARQWMIHFNHRRSDGRPMISSILDLAAFTALDRPGPLEVVLKAPGGETHNALVEYAHRDRGLAPSKDVLPLFDEMLPETHGIMVYQEQLQRVFQRLVGCSLAEAESFRRDVAKKEAADILKRYPTFMEGATRTLGSREDAQRAWYAICTWAAYGFNLSHSVCYSLIGYACAYLRHHYPLEWWAAVLSNERKKEKIAESFWPQIGHRVDPPDIADSGERFEIRGDRIRAPLALIEGIGDAARAELVAGRPYADINDFCRKVQQHKLDGAGPRIQCSGCGGTGVTVTPKKRIERVCPKCRGVGAVRRAGISALNRGRVYTLILGGAMSSLFEPDSTLLDQLSAFEAAMARVTGAKKPEPVATKYVEMDALARFQARKAVLPMFTQPLLSMIPGHHFDPHREDGEKTCQGYLVVDGAKVQRLGEAEPWPPDYAVTLVVPCYVVANEQFTPRSTGKQATKLLVEMDGGQAAEFVRWPGPTERVAPLYPAAQSGAVIMAMVTRRRPGKPFSLNDILLIRAPLSTES